MNATLECRYADQGNCFDDTRVMFRIFGTGPVAHGVVCEKHRRDCEAAGTFTAIVELPYSVSIDTAKLRTSNKAGVAHLLHPNDSRHTSHYESRCGAVNALNEYDGRYLSDYKLGTAPIVLNDKSKPAGICKACLKAIRVGW